MAGRTNSGKTVARYLRYIDRAMDAIEDRDVVGIASVASDMLKELPIKKRYHNPWWIGIPMMAIGRVLIRSAFTPMRRLGWSMIGVGGAQTTAEVTRYALEVAERIRNLQAGGVQTPPLEKYQEGGIGLP